MVAICSVFFLLFGTKNWMWLTLILAALPVIPAILFMTSPIPDMQGQAETAPTSRKSHGKGLALCAFCIFFGSCAENTMSTWVSGYMEQALHISKAVGDILGLAVFAVLLGLVRIGYARFGKKIQPILLWGMVGAVFCYLVAGFSTSVPLAFTACILTGLFTSMLWPGTLIMMEEEMPGIGVFGYALMAASGDFGASLAPQLLGIVTDKVSLTPAAIASGAPAQMGLRAGMQVTAIFPILGIITLLITFRYFKKHSHK
jgi:MFS family permease